MTPLDTSEVRVVSNLLALLVSASIFAILYLLQGRREGRDSAVEEEGQGLRSARLDHQEGRRDALAQEQPQASLNHLIILFAE